MQNFILMDETIKYLCKDSDGMLTYEYIANHIGDCDNIMEDLIENMKRADSTGQFVASTARFLAAVDASRFRKYIDMLIEATIDKDRERRYLGSLLKGIWGEDFQERANELRETDDNFRRIYKRIYPTGM